MEFHEDLLDAFPKLREGGGYELLRTAEGNTKLLDVIPVPPGGYTASFLKDIVMQAKVYIRPVQKDLSLEPGQLSGTPLCLHVGVGL